MTRTWVYAGLAVAAGVGLAKLVHRGPRIVAGSRILLVGDSLAVGLAPYLKCLAGEKKLPYLALAKVSTRIDQWAQSAALEQALASFQPTLVLVSLGTNDAYLGPTAADRQRPWLDRLVARIAASGAEMAWVGPPTLPTTSIGKPNMELVAMLEAKVGSAHWFTSSALQIPRGPDHLHPTARGYAGWAGAIWQWLSGPPSSGTCLA